MKQAVGSVEEVLFENGGKGYTRGYLRVTADPAPSIGRFRNVKITGVADNSLTGVCI